MIFGSILLLMLFAIAIYFIYQKRSQINLRRRLGRTAEEKINADISAWAKHTRNKFIPPNIFSYEENKVFEVDSILITSEALIVIEIKSIHGAVEGNANNEYWTKRTANNTFNITNPIKQNDKHISHIIKMTGVKVPTISLIVFSDKATYVNVADQPSHVIVIKHNELFKTLDKLSVDLPTKLTAEDKHEFYKLINSFKANRKGKNLHKRITKG